MSDDEREKPDETNEYVRYSPECSPTGEDELWVIILALVEEACGTGGDELDSWATSAYERALEALDRAGFVEIDQAAGRIRAKLTPTAREFEAWVEFHDRDERIRKARHELAKYPKLTPEMLARVHDITLAELMGETPESAKPDPARPESQ